MSGGPWYVCAKDTAANVVYVTRDYYSVDKAVPQYLTRGLLSPSTLSRSVPENHKVVTLSIFVPEYIGSYPTRYLEHERERETLPRVHGGTRISPWPPYLEDALH